eukprot:19294-Heterococcus_DN1.PRE.6
MSTQQIWANRLRRELDGLSKHCADITDSTVTLLDHQMDVQNGLCKSYFALHIPLPNAGSDAAVQFTVEVDCDVRTRYPFDPCRMRITEGTPCLPPSLVSNNIVTLPEAATWTPSHTVIGMLQDLVKHVVAANSGGNTTAPTAAEQQGLVVTVSASILPQCHIFARAH